MQAKKQVTSLTLREWMVIDKIWKHQEMPLENRWDVLVLDVALLCQGLNAKKALGRARDHEKM
jgi:hypothetical protein